MGTPAIANALRVYNLGDQCCLLDLLGCHILIDCTLHLQSDSMRGIDEKSALCLSFLEQLDPSLIDVVLISNHKHLFWLPYLTEAPGFHGQIYATEPTSHFAQLLLNEWITCKSSGVGKDKRYVKKEEDNKPSNSSFFASSSSSNHPTPLDKNAVARCIDQIHFLSYCQPAILKKRQSRKKQAQSFSFSSAPSLSSLSSNQSSAQSSSGPFSVSSAAVSGATHDQSTTEEQEEVCSIPIQCTPISSGFSIGSCNWVLQCGSRLASPSSSSSSSSSSSASSAATTTASSSCECDAHTPQSKTETSSSSKDRRSRWSDTGDICVAIVSSSSWSTARHPTSFDLAFLQHVAPHVVLFTSYSDLFCRFIQTPSLLSLLPPSNTGLPLTSMSVRSTLIPALRPAVMLPQLCILVEHAMRRGGKVLLPILPAGVFFDLIEYLWTHLNTRSLVGSDQQSPMFYISDQADETVQYANIVPEWLNKRQQNEVLEAKTPFIISNLIKSGQLVIGNSVGDQRIQDKSAYLYSQKHPCVVFVSHASLLCGNDFHHFLEKWGQDERTTMILLEPEFCRSALLTQLHCLRESFQLKMKTLLCPIDPELTLNEMKMLVNALRMNLSDVIILSDCSSADSFLSSSSSSLSSSSSSSFATAVCCSASYLSSSSSTCPSSTLSPSSSLVQSYWTPSLVDAALLSRSIFPNFSSSSSSSSMTSSMSFALRFLSSHHPFSSFTISYAPLMPLNSSMIKKEKEESKRSSTVQYRHADLPLSRSTASIATDVRKNEEAEWMKWYQDTRVGITSVTHTDIHIHVCFQRSAISMDFSSLLIPLAIPFPPLFFETLLDASVSKRLFLQTVPRLQFEPYMPLYSSPLYASPVRLLLAEDEDKFLLRSQKPPSIRPCRTTSTSSDSALSSPSSLFGEYTAADLLNVFQKNAIYDVHVHQPSKKIDELAIASCSSSSTSSSSADNKQEDKQSEPKRLRLDVQVAPSSSSSSSCLLSSSSSSSFSSSPSSSSEALSSSYQLAVPSLRTSISCSPGKTIIRTNNDISRQYVTDLITSHLLTSFDSHTNNNNTHTSASKRKASNQRPNS